MDIRNCNGIELLKSLDDKSVDLILTDPPYICLFYTSPSPRDS